MDRLQIMQNFGTQAQVNNGDMIVGLYVSMQGEKLSKAFFNPLKKISDSKVLAILWAFNLPYISWQDNMAKKNNIKFLDIKLL